MASPLGAAGYGIPGGQPQTVGVASSLVLRPSDRRKGILFINDSVNTIYLQRGSAAALNTGIRLNPNGGSYTEDRTHSVWLGEWNAIASAAASNLLIVEDL